MKLDIFISELQKLQNELNNPNAEIRFWHNYDTLFTPSSFYKNGINLYGVKTPDGHISLELDRLDV
jgi:hypothetical protein